MAKLKTKEKCTKCGYAAIRLFDSCPMCKICQHCGNKIMNCDCKTP